VGLPDTPWVVLVAEDEGLLRISIANALRNSGCSVVEARSAEEAIAYVSAGHQVDAIFTDIQLAGSLTGWDVAEHGRAVRADMPIIYTSGNAVDRSRRVADSQFFDKPYLLADIVDACRATCS
jgi:CheY-like chemotaxis protein